jgi:hypothetical protein
MSVFELWIPIFLAGLATHVFSTLFWTALPHHKPEWQPLPNEDDFFRSQADKIPAGQYIFPFATTAAACKSEEYKSKMGKCTGMMIIWPSPPNMGKAIGLTLVAFMIISFVIGYLASMGLPKGADFMTVFRFVTTAGLLAHISAKFPFVFWFRRRVAMDVLDGIAFAVATGLIFAWLWP